MNNINFYETVSRKEYGFTGNDKEIIPTDHPGYVAISSFVEKYNLHKKKCLEIGSAKGWFQNLVEDYTGVDVAESLQRYYKKRYVPVKSYQLPFEDCAYDAIWTYAVHEHIPELQGAIDEIIRVLRFNGYLFFAPAWFCRTWAAEGYPVRPYSDFNIKGKLIKASIPLRNSVIYRSLLVFPKRILRHIGFLTGMYGKKLHYKKIRANYSKFWMSDSDACNSIDPHDIILYMQKHSMHCISHPLHGKAFIVRNGSLIFQKNNSSEK